MERPIWAPWRIEYILSDKSGECIFCAKLRQEDGPENLVLERDELVMAVLNRYPYNPGHLMVMPLRHVADPRELTADEWAAMERMTARCLDALEVCMSPQGYNIGMNLGKVAGAGVEDHLHRHVVPRWNGDNNVMPVLGNIRVMPEHLEATYHKVREALNR